MYHKQHHQQHACTLLYTRKCVDYFFLFFWVEILPFIVRTYLVCVPSSRVLYCSSVPRIILSSLACMTCLGSTAQQQSPFSLDSLVPSTVVARVTSPPWKWDQLFLWYVSQTAPSAESSYTAVYSYICHVFSSFFLGWDLAFHCTCVPRVCVVIPCPTLYTHNIISYFDGMYRKKEHHQQACTLLNRLTYPPRDTTSMGV